MLGILLPINAFISGCFLISIMGIEMQVCGEMEERNMKTFF